MLRQQFRFSAATYIHCAIGAAGAGVVLHLILGFFSDHTVANVAEVGSPNVPISKIMKVATKRRSALNTIAMEFSKARQVLGDCLRLSSLLSQLCSASMDNPSWDTPRVVISLGPTVAAEYVSIFISIASIPASDRGFQLCVCREFTLLSYITCNWLLFVKRRLQRTNHSLKGPSYI